MKIGAILPTINLWGGVKRFLELGNRFIAAGHACTIFTPEGSRPDWFDFKGTIARIAEVSASDLDALFITETQFLGSLLESAARKKIFYHVHICEDLKPILAHPEIEIFANSSFVYDFDVKHYRIGPFKAFGGVTIPSVPSIERKRGERFTVIAYGRLDRKRTGARIVIRACERLYRKHKDVFLLLYDTPLSAGSAQRIREFRCKVPFEFVTNHPVERNFELFARADAFAAAEKTGGWSNCTAEALANGVPAVATRAGTGDILIHGETGLLAWRNSISIAHALERLYRDASLRQSLSQAGRQRILEYAWDPLARKIMDFLLSNTR